MRLIMIMVLVAACVWGGYWFAGSRALEQAAVGWFSAEQAAGRNAGYKALSVSGFPNRFDLTVDGLHLESPDGRLAWDAPFAQVFALTYKPWHLIAALPNEQVMTLAGERVSLRSSYLQGSLVVSPNTSAALDRATVIGRDLVAATGAGATFGASEVSLASKRHPSDRNTHEIGLRITDLAPDAKVMAALLDGADLPPVIGSIKMDAVISFSAPLDRFAAETQPAVTRIDLRDATVAWGNLTLTGNGSIVAGADGLAEGRIDWTLQNWHDLPPQLVANALTDAGLIKAEVGPTVVRMIEVMGEQSPDLKAFALPMVFQDGRFSLGSIPIGAAPRLN
jgi:hypothetical protein